MEVRSEVLTMALRDPFRIAREHPEDVATSVIVEVTWGDHHGLGEAAPGAYYGETAETVVAVLPILAAAVEEAGEPPLATAGARRWLMTADGAMESAIGRNWAAKAALDIALHDLLARRASIPVFELLGTSAVAPPTDFSIGIDDPADVAQRAARAASFPALKIKVGGPADMETLRRVREAYDGPIRVDANTGWQPEGAAAMLPELVALGVELIEQPFPAHRLDQLAWLQERTNLPIMADESVETTDDLDALVGVVAAVNVKLMKCGGVGPALRMLERARELGFRSMIGCMVETSVGMAASASVAALAEWVDLDGNLLLARDPFRGLELGSDKRWQLTGGPGLGVTRIRSAPVDGSVDGSVDGIDP
ncbi:dipeptide epimerase [soil metagenome]